jgi:hypothetical protein
MERFYDKLPAKVSARYLFTDVSKTELDKQKRLALLLLYR